MKINSTEQKNRKAIFLDRDGVINKRRDDYVKSIEEFVFLPNIGGAIRKLNDLKFLVIVITNQSAVNRGIITREKLEEIHRYMLEELMKKSCTIDKIYHCPHRPDEGCSCRKPRLGMINQAIGDFGIDTSKSWLIGDSDSDMEAAKNSGLRAIKIDKDTNLGDAVEIISKELV